MLFLRQRIICEWVYEAGPAFFQRTVHQARDNPDEGESHLIPYWDVYSCSYVNNSPNISKMVSVLTVYRITSLAESDTVQFVMCLGSAGALKVRVHQTWPNGFSGSKQSARSKFFDVRVPAHRAM